MKGIILDLIEEAVVASRGEDEWEELLERSDLDGDDQRTIDAKLGRS